MINTWQLSNGAKIVVEDIPYLRSAAIGVYIKVGSRYEESSMAGASHFIEHMLFKGTEKRTAKEIAENFESMGGQLNAYTAKEHTCVYARTLDEDIYAAIDIIFDMLFHAKFSARDYETEREVIVEEIGMYEDSPDELIHDVFAQHFWQGHALGLPILGTLNSLKNMRQEELVDFYHTHYVPANMVIAVAGNVDHHRIYEVIQGITDTNDPAPNNFVQVPERVLPFVSMLPKEIEQVQICMGVPGISFHDENRYTQSVMNSIMGGGMSSRLYQCLREEQGLAYSVFSNAASYSDTGVISINIGTGTGKVERFFDALYEQLNELMNKGVTTEEVNRTKKLMKSSILMGLEGVMNRMSRLGKGVLMYNQVTSPEETIEKINAVTEQQVNLYAADYLQAGKVSMAAIGDKKILPAVEQAFTKWWGHR